VLLLLLLSLVLACEQMPGIMWIIANWIIASLPLDSCSSSGYVARNL